ncbi:hypothetical protein XSR1_40028 [Xenorhabdus szentirmaii DSM 16338]|uniref:Uncharacterized protein n=1 Tax=Xenorhabdus szentirmaii DSM 16338 TaxID=1427518 RepID=W1J2B0_9GAMM|nr:hypothetical protein XSR1_40028 [Xenorhabdus szentirmaii DSM 16338]
MKDVRQTPLTALKLTKYSERCKYIYERWPPYFYLDALDIFRPVFSNPLK